MMRFQTKFDSWLVAVLFLSAFISCFVVPATLFRTPAPKWFPILLTVFCWTIWLLALSCTLPQYYEIREDGLFIRQGWKKLLIPYPSLTEVETWRSFLSAAVFSADRIVVTAGAYKCFVIAVVEKERFFAELSNQCPQLEKKNTISGLSLQRARF
jgi:hypothetical protein